MGSSPSGSGRRSGSWGGSMRWIIHWPSPVRNKTWRPCTRSPCRSTITSSLPLDGVVGAVVPETWRRRRSCPWGSRPRSRCTGADGPRWGRRGGSRSGSGGTPLGSAHETSTPSRSSRKSQCRRRAWCSWTTNRACRDLACRRGRRLGPSPAGSGVAVKSRLAWYFSSGGLTSASRADDGAGARLVDLGWRKVKPDASNAAGQHPLAGEQHLVDHLAPEHGLERERRHREHVGRCSAARAPW